MEFKNDGNKKYKVKTICNSAIYAKESKSSHLPGLYYLMSWKSYLEKKNTWKPVTAVHYLQRLLSIFHKEHLKKPTITSPLVSSTAPMAKFMIKPSSESLTAKQKRGRPAKTIDVKKYTKKSQISKFRFGTRLSKIFWPPVVFSPTLLFSILSFFGFFS